MKIMKGMGGGGGGGNYLYSSLSPNRHEHWSFACVVRKCEKGRSSLTLAEWLGYQNFE